MRKKKKKDNLQRERERKKEKKENYGGHFFEKTGNKNLIISIQQ